MKISKFKIILILTVLMFATLFTVPNFVSESKRSSLPSFMQNKALSLGLDLKGGAYLLLEVDTSVVLKDKIEQLKGEIRTSLRGDSKKDRIVYRNIKSTDSLVSLTIKDSEKLSSARFKIKEGSAVDLDIQTKGNRLTVGFSKAGYLSIVNDALDRSIEIVRRRVDALGTKEPSIQKQGESRIIVQLPGVENPAKIKELIGKTAKMTFHKVDDTVNAIDVLDGKRELPVDVMLVANGDSGFSYIAVKKQVAVSGEHLSNSQATFDNYGRPAVTTVFNRVGAKKFAKLTGENIGQRFAIVLDKKVLSAPVIQEKIPSGTGQITGSFSIQEAQELSMLLRSGALPAPLEIVEERTVGAGLGADSISAGKFASLLGLILVATFMIITYGVLGLLADVILCLNMLIIIGTLGLFGATLTLPGIAGIVLTIGMAVDASVLIFERMREEYKSGISPIMSIEHGFDRAVATIVDSNITTLVASVLLFQFGTGPVRGFAVTLAIGILSTLFSSVVAFRVLLEVWAKKSKTKTLPFKINK